MVTYPKNISLPQYHIFYSHRMDGYDSVLIASHQSIQVRLILLNDHLQTILFRSSIDLVGLKIFSYSLNSIQLCLYYLYAACIKSPQNSFIGDL